MAKLTQQGRKLSNIPDNSTGDLRSRAVDQNRDRERKQKWSPKWARAGNTLAVPSQASGKQRPVVKLNRKTELGYRQNIHMLERNHALNKLPKLNDDQYDLRETYYEDSYEQDSSDTTSVVEDDFSCPSEAINNPAAHGQQVLEVAVAKAVERYEDQKTTRLVNEEYEILDSASELEAESSQLHMDEDDDFELV